MHEAAESGDARASAKTSAKLPPRPPPKLPQKHPQVKKIPSAPAIVAGAGARLLTSAPGMVARARAHARQGPAAVAPPEHHPGPAQMYVPERQDTWLLGSSRGE